MNRFWTLAAVGGAVSVLFVGGAVVTASPALAQGGNPKPPQEVRVVNTTSESVPVSVQGTPDVTVSSLPAVQLSGTPTVNVGSVTTLPAVEIDGTASVSVTNTTPIPVTFASSREPIDRIHSLTFPDGQIGGGDNVYSVPAGRMLVIERFFVTAVFDEGTISSAELTRVNGDLARFPVLMQHQGTDSIGKEHYVGSIEGPFFFPAGSTVQGSYLRTGTGNTVMQWSFTGYLEIAPTPQP